MLVLPELTVMGSITVWKEIIAFTLRKHLEDWKTSYPTLFIVDEPWGYAPEVLEQNNQTLTVVLTSSPVPEYWQYLLTLKPNVLLAGDVTWHNILEALKQTKPNQVLDLSPKHTNLLTTTESKILWHLAGIKSNRQIASALNIQEHTVANHLTAIFNKLGLANREEAMLYYWGALESARRR